MNAAGFGGTVTARDSAPDITEWDDAEHVMDYIGGDAEDIAGGVELGSGGFPHFIYGRGYFRTEFVRVPMELVSQIAYVTELVANVDGERREGLLVLVGAMQHSTYGPRLRQAAAWTPSTPEGLAYAFHIRRGGIPEDFNPIAAHHLVGEQREHLAADLLTISQVASEYPQMIETVDFVAQLHGVLYSTDGPGDFYLGVPKLDMPPFLAFGAPLTIKRVGPPEKGAGYPQPFGKFPQSLSRDPEA